MNNYKFEVRDLFDVWGNEEEGWWVNDSTVVGVMELPKEWTGDDVYEWLEENTRLRLGNRDKLSIQEFGMDHYEVVMRETELPLYEFYSADYS